MSDHKQSAHVQGLCQSKSRLLTSVAFPSEAAPAGQPIEQPPSHVPVLPLPSYVPKYLFPVLAIYSIAPVADKFWLIGSLFTASILFNLESRRYGLNHCSGCRDGKLFMPEHSEGQYAVMLPFAALSWHLAYKWKKQDVRAWWLLDAVQIGGHAFEGFHNAHLIASVPSTQRH